LGQDFDDLPFATGPPQNRTKPRHSVLRMASVVAIDKNQPSTGYYAYACIN
jgi:hypothetical protein